MSNPSTLNRQRQQIETVLDLPYSCTCVIVKNAAPFIPTPRLPTRFRLWSFGLFTKDGLQRVSERSSVDFVNEGSLERLPRRVIQLCLATA